MATRHKIKAGALFVKLVDADFNKIYAKKDFWIAKKVDPVKDLWRILFTNKGKTDELVRWDEPPYNQKDPPSTLKQLCERGGLKVKKYFSETEYFVDML